LHGRRHRRNDGCHDELLASPQFAGSSRGRLRRAQPACRSARPRRILDEHHIQDRKEGDRS
jgi:hypothetical protein